ncbi:MAG: methylamine dehydrogenase light chain [Steroidobacteraceae bacterium]
MLKIFEKLEIALDRTAERKARAQASSVGRRSFLSTLGKAMVGAAAVPMLPFDRFGEAQAAIPGKHQSENTETCDYWRYCAMSGVLCSCCGGSVTSCPPGTEVSKVTWIGTCENPDDKRNYLISYNDCCGKVTCGLCSCSNHEREKPGYRLGLHNGINWCMANNQNNYHCTVGAIVGLAAE